MASGRPTLEELRARAHAIASSAAAVAPAPVVAAPVVAVPSARPPKKTPAAPASAAPASAAPAPAAPAPVPEQPAPVAPKKKRRQVAPAEPAKLVEAIAPAAYVGSVAAPAPLDERALPKTVELERFAKPLEVSLRDPGLSTLFSFLDFRAHLERSARNIAVADRGPEERAQIFEDAQRKVDEMTELMHADTDPLALHRKFYGMGAITDEMMKKIPRLASTDRPPVAAADIPLVHRDHLTRYMMGWAPGLGPMVRQCRDTEKCVFKHLCRVKEHPDPIARRQVLPGRAFYTPVEEAAGCDEPRFCYFCIVLMVNVAFHHYVRQGSAGVAGMAINPFRVYVDAPGEFCLSSVRQSVDGLTYGLMGYFPKYAEHTFVVRRADDATGPYGFVSSEPVFGRREAAGPTPQ
jgi:hypothetical protein